MSAVMETMADDEAFDPFAGGVIERIAPTTEAQREIWLGDRLGPEASLCFNLSTVLQLRGALDAGALTLALDRLLARHESLRATISPDGMQLLIGEAAPLALAEHDLTQLEPAAQQRRLAEDCATAVQVRFRLERGPLFRAALYRLSGDEHVLVITAHHAVCDGWSWGVVTDELGRLYAQQLGAGPDLPPAPLYSDYAAWEAQEAASPAMQAHVDYWLGRFGGGSLPVLELPLDHRRPAVRTFASRRAERPLDHELTAALRKLSANAGHSLFATLFGAFAALLHRLTDQEDLVIGVAAAGQIASEMPALVGHCVNLLPVRVAVDTAMPFGALAGQSASALLDALDHQTLTYGALLKKLPLARDPSRLPLVSVLFNLDRDTAPGEGTFADLVVAQTSIARAYENFELFLNLAPLRGGLQLEMQYNADLFDEPTILRWLALYECLLRAVLNDPAQAVGGFALLSAEDARALASLQPAPTAVAGASLMHAGFAARAAAQPARPALRHGAQRCSYGELDAQSNRLAHALRARGAGRGQRIGLCLERGIDMVLALLAVLKSGAAYVPLDPDFPQARLDYYAEDARLSLLLTASTVASAPRAWCPDAAGRVVQLDLDTAWKREPASALAPGALDAQAEDPAYVIYTSGSTGKPKGVCVPHRAVANLLQSMQREPGIGATDRIAAVTTLSFDIAVAEIMLPLAAGAESVIVPRDVAMDGNRLRALLESDAITVLQATPGMWRLLLDAQWWAAPGFRAWIGGEPVSADLALALLDRGAELWNVYGPTETTVWSTLWRMDRGAVASRGVSIGRPIDNTGVWILDSRLRQCPIGLPGEICISGAGVTLGYLDRPELTAERFVRSCIDGRDTLVYRTGDRGRWRNDGLLEHLGRFDFQVKVRGYRVELGEVEAGCNAAPGVAHSVAMAREDEPGDVRLVAYLVMAPGCSCDRAALREHLRARLPQYMLPQHVVVLPALPLLPNGKLDRKALPPPNAVAASKGGAGPESGARLAPRNERERTVLAAMEEVLRLPGMSVLDDFFAMGGHSLLAALLATRLNSVFGIQLTLGKLFEAPTAERLALEIDRAQGAADAPVGIARRPEEHSAPLTFEQQRMRFAEELHPDATTFNTPTAHRLSGPMDRRKFEQALREIVRRQEALRTCIVPAPRSTGWVQQIAAELAFELPFEDLRGIRADQKEGELLRRMQAIVDQPIAAAHAPLFRCALYQLGDQEHAFLFMAHHLIWDGASFDILQREMAAAYAAQIDQRPNPLPQLSVSHGDYAQWQLGWLEGPAADSQRSYWRQRLRAAPVLAPVPADGVARRGAPGQGAHEQLDIDEAQTEALRELAAAFQLTLNMLLMAAYAVAISNAVRQPAVSIGMPVRGRIQPELEHAMGFFVGLVPVSLDARRELRFADFVASLKQEVVGALAHQDLPFEQVRQQASPEQQRAGLYQALFSFQDARAHQTHWGPLLARETMLPLQTGVTDNLGLWMVERPAGLQGSLVYNSSLYTRATAAALLQDFLDILRAIAGQPHATLGELATAEARSTLTPRRPRALSAAVPLLAPEQARLAQIWASAIGIDVNEIRASDNFFDLGGDSLLAMRVVQQAETALGSRVEARRYVFESLGQLASGHAAGGADTAPQAAAPQRGRLLGRMFRGWGRKS